MLGCVFVTAMSVEVREYFICWIPVKNFEPDNAKDENVSLAQDILDDL